MSVREQIRRWGIWLTLYSELAERLRRLGLRIFRIYLRPHHGASEPHDAGEHIVFRVVDFDELRMHARDPELDMTGAFLDEAEARGEMCVGTFDDGRLVAYIWRAFGPAPAEDGMWIRFNRPYRYGYKSFTRPEYRGLHIQSAMAPTTDDLLSARGYTHAISYVELDRYHSHRSSVRHGNVAVGYAGYLRAFGRVWTFASPGAKRHGFVFFDPTREPDELTSSP